MGLVEEPKICEWWGSCGVLVVFIGNRHGHLSSNPERGFYISHWVNTHRKGTNPSILPLAMCKLKSRQSHLNLICQPVEKKSFEFKAVNLRKKNLLTLCYILFVPKD